MLTKELAIIHILIIFHSSPSFIRQFHYFFQLQKYTAVPVTNKALDRQKKSLTETGNGL